MTIMQPTALRRANSLQDALRAIIRHKLESISTEQLTWPFSLQVIHSPVQQTFTCELEITWQPRRIKKSYVVMDDEALTQHASRVAKEIVASIDTWFQSRLEAM